MNYGFFITLKRFLFQSFQPLLHLRFAASHFMSIDAELARDRGLREGFPHVVGTGSQTAALVGGEGDDGLAVEVDVLEQREHHLRVGAPPHGTADEDGVVAAEVGSSALVGRQLACGGLLLGQLDERRVGHAVVFVGDDLELVGARDFTDVVGHDLGVARVDDTDGIVVPRVGEENDDGFFHVSGICFLFVTVFVLPVAAGGHNHGQDRDNDVLEFHSLDLFVNADKFVLAGAEAQLLGIFHGVDAVFLVYSIHKGLRVIAVAVRVVED